MTPADLEAIEREIEATWADSEDLRESARMLLAEVRRLGAALWMATQEERRYDLSLLPPIGPED